MVRYCTFEGFRNEREEGDGAVVMDIGGVEGRFLEERFDYSRFEERGEDAGG